jgi:hypothetical protein
MQRRLTSFIIGLTVAAVGCSNPDAPASDHRLDGLKSALAEHPDAATRDATRTLVNALDVEQWGYLTYAEWPAGDGVAALADPALRSAIDALARADGFSLDGQAYEAPLGGGDLGRPYQLPAGSEVSFDPGRLKEENDAAVLLMTEKNGRAFAGNPGVAAAWANLLYQTIKTTTGSPLPTPGLAADGTEDGCGKSWQTFPGGAMGPRCSPIDFCCNGVVNFDKGTTTSTCHDFTSCRGATPLPKLSGCDCGAGDSAGGADGSGITPIDTDNVCIVGNGVAVDPTPWIEACQYLNPSTPNPITCLDAQPTLMVGAPVLSDGRDPSKVCKVFTNEDGAGTSLGMPIGCDHEGGLKATCYCCPSD